MRKTIYKVRFTHKRDSNIYYLTTDDNRYYGLGDIKDALIFKTVNEAQRLLETAFYKEHLFNNYYIDIELDLT